MESNENIVSRRSFFRSTIKSVLPILTLLVLPSWVHAKKLSYTPSTCHGTCTGTCTRTCTGTCMGLCAVTCGGACNATCLHSCRGSCRGSCSGSCES